MKILKEDWEKDVVYLYQFKRNPYVPNLSPFCMKIELFLRANNIPHQVIENNKARSTKGQLPFIELNGKQIADSEFINYELSEKFNIQNNISSEKSGSLRALTRVFDVEVSRLMSYFKIKTEEFPRAFMSVTDLPKFTYPIIIPLVRRMVKKSIKKSGYNHSDSEMKEILVRDLKAASDILGSNKFLGGEKMAIADCAVFGQLASVYFIPWETEAHEILRTDFPNLIKYIENIAAIYFSEFPCGQNGKPM
uniref:GST C-terminal domain-containing protein n=1 Tax=Panagrolaimus davidi TaxID=227884 RepID=A0A914QJN9_9BILA